MIQQAVPPLADLYEADETAWLETMSELIGQGRLADLDYPHLAEYLADMAKRDRREVESRLKILMTHLLKWRYQPAQRSRGWQASIIHQRQELEGCLGRGILLNHAEAVLASVYAKAVELASAETGLPASSFPAECPYTLDQLLAAELPAE